MITGTFASMQLWGGGFVVGQDAPYPSGVNFMRTDSFGAYLYGTNDSRWHQVITSASFANAACDASTSYTHPGSCFGYYPATGTSQTYQGFGAGVVEICGAPSNSSIAYMFYGGLIYVSTNIDPTNPDSETWLNTNQLAGGGFTKTSDNSNITNRYNGRFCAVDPNNVNHVIFGTQASGIWESLDGGSTWAAISTSDIPLAAGATNYQTAFDPASGTTTRGGVTVTNTLYVFSSNGSAPGVYKSTTGGGTGTWSLTSGGPTSMQHMVVAQTGGLLWAVNGATIDGSVGGLFKYNGTWSTEIATTAGLHSVAVNPSNVNHVVALNAGGSVMVTTTGSGGFGSLISETPVAGDAPWQAKLATNIFGQTAGDISLDSSDNMLFDGGQGIWRAALPSGPFNWTANVAGVMQPIGQQIVVPKALTAVAGFQDIGSCTMTLGSPPTTCNPITQYKSLEFASGIDVSKTDANFMVERISNNFGALSDYSGYSNDGFVSNYLPFNTWNATVSAATAIADNGSGLIRVTAPTTGLTTWAAGSGSIVCSYATAALGISALNNAGVACYAVTVIDSTHFDLQGSTFATALTTTGTNYVFYAPPPTYLSNMGGALNVVTTASDSGKIQVKVMSAVNNLVNGAPVYITGVLGTTEANGEWVISNLNTPANTFDLGPTSAFSNAYTGGGSVATWQEPGGAIAAASDTNIVSLAGNDALGPKCSIDGGQTWVDIANPSPAPQTTVTGGPYAAGTTSITVSSISGLSSGAVVRIVMDDGRYFYTSISGAPSGLTVSLAAGVPVGRSIQTGANFFTRFGWITAAFLNSHPLAADWVAPNTFYAVNMNTGMVTWTNCGTATLVNTANINTGGSWQTNGGSNVTLKSVPGHANHIFWSVGPQGSPNAIAPQGLFQSCNAGSNPTTMTFRLLNVFSAQFFGFGAPKAGSVYPTIYYVGWYDTTHTNTEANATFGIWKSTDNPGDCVGSGTFTQVLDSTTGSNFPLGWMLTFKDITGDPLWPSPIYINTGAGPVSGTFN